MSSDCKKLTRFTRRFAERVAAGEIPTHVIRDMKPYLKTPNVRACRLMALPAVQERIAQLEEDALREAGVTHVRIIKDLVSVKNRCMQAEAVYDRKGDHVLTETPAGEPAKAYTFNPQGAVKSLELLGRYKRLWGEDKAPASAPIGPGLTVIVQQAVQVEGQQAVQQHRVEVRLPEPA